MNYFQYCEDEALKIKVEGMPIHRFFAPEGFLQWGLEPQMGNYKGYAQIVDMPIDEFLGLAEPIPEDDLKRHAPMEEFERDVASGKPTNWELPYLEIRENEDGLWKVVGHDGRHRGMLLQHLHYGTMPVLLLIPDATLNEELLPEILWSQNDKAIERPKDFYNFPITEENFQKPYVALEGGIAKVGNASNPTMMVMDGIEYGKGCDASNLKQYLGKVDANEHNNGSSSIGRMPTACKEAKKNFARNFVDNVAYRKDNTMPASSLKEYLAKK